MREYPGARPCPTCDGDAKVPVVAVSNGGELREWRRSRGWDVPELARRLRRAAGEPIAAHDGLVRMIRAWERGDHRPSERYELLYRGLGLPPGNENGADPRPAPTRRQEGTEPVRRRTFVELTGISLAGAMLPGAAAASPATSIEPLGLMLTGIVLEPPAAPSGLTGMALSVARARKDYQACRYAELVSRLPRLLSQLDTACRCRTGDDRLRACALSADAYHVAAGFLLKTGDLGLAHVATDRSMTAALASQDPLTVGASARIVTHTLMCSGHLAAAVTTAQNHAARLEHATRTTTPEALSVYGSLLLRGSLAAAQHDDRATAHEMLAEAAGTARRLGPDANLRGTAFGPVNTRRCTAPPATSTWPPATVPCATTTSSKDRPSPRPWLTAGNGSKPPPTPAAWPSPPTPNYTAATLTRRWSRFAPPSPLSATPNASRPTRRQVRRSVRFSKSCSVSRSKTARH